MSYRYLVTQPDLNSHGTLHGGVLMRWVDEACGMEAKIETGNVCATRHIKGIDFISTARLGDIVEITVRPEGDCEMDFNIKKSDIAINSADARPSRWTGGEKLDVAIKDLQFDKRKVSLSIKLLEEIEKKEALEKYGSEGSGKNLPFSSLSEDLKKKEEDKE